jgi:RimJ/RimL family protein N-acetyltransferase
MLARKGASLRQEPALPLHEVSFHETSRLWLTPLKKGDFSALSGLWRELYGQSAGEGRRMFKFSQKNQASCKMALWLLRLKAANALIGACEFNRIDINAGQAYIGCALKKSFQNQGYMYEALRAVIGYSFAHGGFAALYADIAKDNRPSLSLFAKLGFTPAGRDDSSWRPNGALRFCLSRERATSHAGCFT